MEYKSPILNILTHDLRGEVTRPLYLEYTSRRRELDRIWAEPNNNYQMLQGYASTVEALLAVSLFYRHVMGHLQGASSFYYTVNKRRNNKDRSIKIGSSILDGEQQRHLYSAVLAFNVLQEKYQLSPGFYEFADTLHFLRNCRDLYNKKEYEEDDTI